MSFNAGKCKVMHIATNNPRFSYYVNRVKVDITEEKEDKGVSINPSLKPSNYCRKAAIKAQAVPMQIVKNFHYRNNQNTFLKIYKQYKSHT
jgi:hypothetical protein